MGRSANVNARWVGFPVNGSERPRIRLTKSSGGINLNKTKSSTERVDPQRPTASSVIRKSEPPASTWLSKQDQPVAASPPVRPKYETHSVRGTPGPEHQPATKRGPWIAAASAASVAVVASVGMFVLSSQREEPRPVAVAPIEVTSTAYVTSVAPVTPSSTTSLATVVKPVDPDVASLATLSALRSQDRARTPLDSSYVAQVASQFVGVVDPTIQSDPMTITDILRVSQGFRSNPSYGSEVKLFKQGDFGKIVPRSSPIWITIVALEMGSADDVKAWCLSNFSGTAEDVAKQCIPRKLTSPHS